MKQVKQTIFGSNGNCLQACIASLLEIPLDDVPYFPIEGQFFHLERYMERHGLSTVALPIKRAIYPYKAFVLQWGISPRNIRHSVIAQHGKMVHDPHPSNAGLIEVEQVCLFVRNFNGT